ncbi:MAG: glycosyltransferase family 2 protein [Candidatus Zixiibacteriota bacterium]
MGPKVPKVSIIVVAHNSLPALSGCLKALDAAVAGIDHELILVDNASTDRSAAEAVQLFPLATVLKNDKNLGFAAACNRGAEVAAGEWLLFLNPDVTIDRDALAHLLTAAQSNENAGLISGRLRNADGSFQPTCRQFPTIGNIFFSRGSALAWLLKRPVTAGVRYTLPDYDQTTAVPAVAATMVMIKRDLFEQVGRFDTRFFMYMEDTDLSLRLHQHGRVNLFVPSAGGVHRWGEGTTVGRVRRLLWHHHSVWKYFLKHFPNGFSVVLLPLLLAANLAIQIVRPSKRARQEAS